ncbi:glycosyltransferase family 2 protein [Halobacteriovorax sp. HLS]|uniref:glycosyltransferase family 2 protein n=1 Tax=Halobacteriovorax sp. HLS TaxID=2234000 RepID=UPI0013E36C53|nr:glycosyltransferase family 2 protein [Halobacteriovorax sp. HLS]
MNYFLSISIPTYNRSSYLKDTIECFAKQINDRKDIQIAVADNFSTDDTEEMISEMKKKYPYIKYHKNSKNLGADRNYLKAVEISDGKFCWLFGSDDQICENALEKVISSLKDKCSDILLMNRLNMCPELKEERGIQRYFRSDEEFSLDFSELNSYVKYSNEACDIASMFSYLSSIVLNKEKWDVVDVDNSFIGGAYIHVSKLFGMMNRGCSFHFLPEALVLNRQGNDHFAGSGYVKRRLIDVGYVDLVEKSFSEEKYKVLLRKIVEREFFTLPKILAFKMWTYKYQTNKDFLELFNGYKTFENYPHYRIRMWFFKNIPNSVLRLIYRIFY